MNPSQDTQAKPDKQVKQDKLEARLKQLDHYKQIHKQDSSDASGNSDEEDEIEKEKIREVTVVIRTISTGHCFLEYRELHEQRFSVIYFTD